MNKKGLICYAVDIKSGKHYKFPFELKSIDVNYSEEGLLQSIIGYTFKDNLKVIKIYEIPLTEDYSRDYSRNVKVYK